MIKKIILATILITLTIGLTVTKAFDFDPDMCKYPVFYSQEGYAGQTFYIYPGFKVKDVNAFLAGDIRTFYVNAPPSATFDQVEQVLTWQSDVTDVNTVFYVDFIVCRVIDPNVGYTDPNNGMPLASINGDPAAVTVPVRAIKYEIPVEWCLSCAKGYCEWPY